MPILVKTTHRFNVITIKIPMEFFMELEEIILKFVMLYFRAFANEALDFKGLYHMLSHT